jgi:hypothetical protein
LTLTGVVLGDKQLFTIGGQREKYFKIEHEKRKIFKRHLLAVRFRKELREHCHMKSLSGPGGAKNAGKGQPEYSFLFSLWQTASVNSCRVSSKLCIHGFFFQETNS